MDIERTVEEYVPRALTPTAPSDTFAEMVRLVRKYANDIQAEKHRQELLDVALQCELPTVEERACWGIQQIRVANALPQFVVEALEEMVRRAMHYAARAEIYGGKEAEWAAARDDARDDARAKQNERLTAMVMAAREKESVT